jgi:DNA end-binding protein Ku
VIDLMAALKKSVGGKGEAPAKKPGAKKAAAKKAPAKKAEPKARKRA